MYEALGLGTERAVLIGIMLALGVAGIAALFAGLFWSRKFRLPYSAEVGFVALLVVLLIYGDYSSSTTYRAYEALLPQEGEMGVADEPPPGTFEKDIRVLAFQWGFIFFDGDKALRNVVQVPPGARVLFRLGASDVIHGFNVPVASITAELEPGDIRYVWLRAPEEPGRYLIQCLNYCGLGHAQMKAWLVVAEEGEEAGDEEA